MSSLPFNRRFVAACVSRRVMWSMGAAGAFGCALIANADSLSWTNAGGGNAHVAGNWSPVQAPAAGDFLSFMLGGSYTVTYTVNMPDVLSHTYGGGGTVTAQCNSPHSAFNINIFTGSTLTLADGTMEAGGSIVIGNVAGAPATLNMQGGSILEGPTLLNPGLLVGNNTGEGALNITGGARLLIDTNSVTHVEIGNDASEVGDVTVSGAGFAGLPRSSLICQPVNDIELANNGGTGTITILGGGLVNCDNMFVANTTGSDGEITVSGSLPPLGLTRSTLAVANDLELAVGTVLNNGDAILEIGDRGLVTVGGDTLVGSGVASNGFGTLRILPGGSLTTGTLNVSELDASLQHFGGTITIDGGALFTDDDGLILSGIDPASPPTITLINDADVILDGDVIIGAIAAADGILNIRDLGTSLTPPANGQIIVGDAAGGSGTVNVEDDAYILANNVSTTIIVGKDGTGTMNVNSGAVAYANNIRLGTQPAGDGTINVDGPTSLMLATNNMHVAGSNTGAQGTGVVNVSNQGELEVNNQLVIWPDGEVNVDSGILEVNGDLDVRGTLDLDNAALPTDLADVYADSTLTIFSNGTLTGEGNVHGNVTNNGTIDPTGDGLIFDNMVTGTGVSFSGAPVEFISVGGFTGTGVVDCQVSGTYTTDIFPTGALTLGRSGSGAGFDFQGTLHVGAHTVTLLDANYAHCGEIELQGGMIVAANGLDIEPTNSSDELTGFGTIQGNVRCAAIISPGLDSPSDQTGLISITGDLDIDDPAAQVNIQLEGRTLATRDRIVATGAVTLDGALNITALNAYVPTNGTSFVIISGSSISGTFDTVTGPADVQVLYGPTTVSLRRLTCPADCAPVGALDNQVNVTDLLAVISAWGTCPGCPSAHCGPDVAPSITNGDCQINVTDLLAVISAWGSCP